MFRNQYDNDITTFSPQGRLHQIEYAMEAVKQGSACVGLKSNTHVVLLAIQRRLGGELAGYQKKIMKLDNHIGVAFAGLFSDARVLTNYMRTECLRHQFTYARPIPSSRLMLQVAAKAQTNTQEYGLRPYGVGFLVGSMEKDHLGNCQPHLYELSPSANVVEYYAHAIGARSQSARTYLEKHLTSFASCTELQLIQHGIQALKLTLPSDKPLTMDALSIMVVDETHGYRDVKKEIIEHVIDLLSSTSITTTQQTADDAMQVDTPMEIE
ncbi:hypothetical protein HMI54_001460 [Coelomomyces lativittatus]|nr:hypothetical protein HMI54_001460 [Coelomomyces lativittatus]KAJ1514389.1 hypothetical protein HMI56_000569 [Coelomomyces lativittatus]KAJ1517928.1 hypothetical protein HMI55_004819 [Coelomomyces lativittatus]